jgi:predicted ATP-dependent serine protease
MMAKRGLHWCDTCDAAMVGKNGKCPACGSRAKGNKRIKAKSVPLDDVDDEPNVPALAQSGGEKTLTKEENS